MGNEEFGAYLKTLLKARSGACTVKSLTSALGYQDPSTVYRWLRGEKPPALNSGDYEKIIEHLKLSQTEARDLRTAQVNSLANRPTRRQRLHQPDTSARSPVAPLLDNWGGSARGRRRIGPTSADARGADILREMIELLDGTPPADGLSEEERTITLTWQSSDPIEMSADLQENWLAALQAVLRRKWRVQYLCRLDGDGVRTMRLVEMMRGLIGMGEYYPRYFTSYGVLTPPYDLLIVPGHFAVALFAGKSPNAVDDGCVSKETHSLEVLQAHARQLALQTAPLMTRYLPTEVAQVEKLLRDAEGRPGGRVAIKDGLSVTTQPEAWFDERGIARFADASESADLTAMARVRGERIAAFKRTLRQYTCYDICSKRAIERLTQDGVYPQDDGLLRGVQSAEMVLEHLRNVVSLLETYNPRYQLALVDDQQVSSRGPTGIPLDLKWAVTGDRSVFIGLQLPAASGGAVDASLHITEPTVAEGFGDHFHQLWDRIPPSNRERKDVIAWLNERIARLEAANSGSLK